MTLKKNVDRVTVAQSIMNFRKTEKLLEKQTIKQRKVEKKRGARSIGSLEVSW